MTGAGTAPADAPAAAGTAPADDGSTAMDRRARIAACLVHASAGLGLPVSRALIEEADRPDEDDDGLRAAIRAAEAAGFQVGFGPLSPGELDAALLPAILLTGDGAVVVEGLRRGGFDVFDPRLGEGTGRMTAATLGKVATGEALILRPAGGAEAPGAGEGHWFWSAIAANRWSYLQVILAAAVANVLALTTSIFIMVVYDRVLPNQATESLVALTVGVGIALVFDFAIKTLRAGFIDRAGQRADLVIGRQVFARLLSLRMAVRKGSTGAMAAALREFDMLRDFMASATLVAVVDLPFVFLFVFVISLIGGPLAVIPLIALPVVLVVALLTQPVLSRLAERSFADGQSKQAVLVETLSGLETIKTARAEAHMAARWDRALAAQAGHGVRTRAVSQFALNATAFTQQAAQVLIVFYGVFLIIENRISMGALIASVILTGRALAPLGQVAQTLVRASQARTAYRAIDALMRAKSERPPGRRFLSRPRVAGRLSFNDVSFAYPDAREEALKGVSLEIAAGEKVAVIGPIGSGKSTVARLALGLYEPTRGAVRIDGTDIRQVDPGDLRRNIGSVLQDVWLFSGTLLENIAIGAARPRDEEVLEVARLAGVDDFAARHPDGYALRLRERGEGLSGGQRQSIALARALLGAPPVLVLDEPTSAMDVATEKAVIARLKAHAADRTLIVVTHRMSLLDLVDRVIVLQDGRVVADGPKAEIIGAGPGQGQGQGAADA